MIKPRDKDKYEDQFKVGALAFADVMLEHLIDLVNEIADDVNENYNNNKEMIEELPTKNVFCSGIASAVKLIEQGKIEIAEGKE